MQEPQHALRLGKIGDDVRNGALLGHRQRIGQGGDDFGAQMPVAGAAASGARALMRAQ